MCWSSPLHHCGCGGLDVPRLDQSGKMNCHDWPVSLVQTGTTRTTGDANPRTPEAVGIRWVSGKTTWKTEQGVGSRSELLNLLGDVKARVQDKIGIVDFPMPQFILIGKQSVGKSRLIEALAGETFNFISGTLGSRRPTILEFRNVGGVKNSRWFVRDRQTGHWNQHEVSKVMQLVGDAHEELGETVSPEPICVRVELGSQAD
eukprot:symbB.v1.2.026403.t1/scaffold2635.1/size74366/1